jgi:hypothetical protein
MPFFHAGTYDLFLVHAWHYTDEWQLLVATLDEHIPGKWRNWSLPWHDTSIDRYSVVGKAQLEALLDGHISMASVMILIPEIVKTGEGRFWVETELQIAATHSKPVVGVLPLNGEPFPAALIPRTHRVVKRDAQEILEAVRALTGVEA